MQAINYFKRSQVIPRLIQFIPHYATKVVNKLLKGEKAKSTRDDYFTVGDSRKKR